MSASLVLNTPRELVLGILAFLDIPSLCICRQVCRDFKEMVDTTAELQYAIQLYASAAENNPNDQTTSAASRLQKLKDFQDAWANLKFQPPRVIDMERGGIWELYGGVLAQGIKMNRGGLSFYRPPSHIRDITQKRWTLSQPPPFDIRDFGMDPAQDLLVLIESPQRRAPFFLSKSQASRTTTHVLHLLSLESSPGSSHPKANRDGVLQLTQSFIGGASSYTVQIAGRHVGLLIHTRRIGRNQLIVWDWMTGEKLLDIVGPTLRTFAFLSDRHILLGTCVLPLLPDDVGDDGERLEPNLIAVDFIEADKNTQEVTELRAATWFSLPQLADATVVVGFEIRSDPAPGWRPGPEVDVPFHVTTDQRIYVVTLWVHSTGELKSILLFCPRKTLMANLGRGDEGKSKHSWDTWGPAGTMLRLMHTIHPHVWVCYVFGTRYVTLDTSTFDEEEDVIRCQVFDFNPIALRKDLNVEAANKTVNGDEDERGQPDTQVFQVGATVTPREDVFENDVRTELPYRCKSVALADLDVESRYAVMCTEDSLIVVDDAHHKYRIYSL